MITLSSKFVQPRPACSIDNQRYASETRTSVIASATSRRAKKQDLWRTLLKQAGKETLPWIKDLAFPILGREDNVEANFKKEEEESNYAPSQLADPDSRFIPVQGGIRLHIKDHYPSSSSSSKTQLTTLPTVILIHGFNGSTFSWRANAQAIADATGCRVVSYDRPPFGLSERPLDYNKPGQALQFNPYELSGSVKLTEGLLDSLGVVGDVVAVGHSAGALVALELYKARPEQITGLCLVAPAVPTTPDRSFERRITFGGQLRFLLIRAILQSDTVGLRYVRRQILKQKERVKNGELGFVPHPATASTVLSTSGSGDESNDGTSSLISDIRDDYDSSLQQLALEEATEGYLRPLKARDWDKAALLNFRAFTMLPAFDYSTVKVPVLVVQGTEDTAVPVGNTRVLVDLLQDRKSASPKPATVYKEMATVGHVPMDERPAAFNGYIADFINTYMM